nr:TIGR03435 family protein [Terriglobus roseus]
MTRSFSIALLLCIAPLLAAHAQSEKAASGHAMRFEVASIHPDDGPFKSPSFAMSADDSFRDPKGRFHADFALPVYIQFAYKIWLTNNERKEMIGALPEWVEKQRFDIEATAPENATKDQYRQMMQTLLAERFGLKLHLRRRNDRYWQ